MKKSAFPAALLLLALASSGCPVYDSDDGCFDDWDCYDGYVCDGRTGACVAATSTTTDTCRRPNDCGTNETCSRSGTCVVGDCHFRSVGCVSGYTCSASSGRWQCEPGDGNEAGADAGGNANAGAPSSSGAGAASSSAGESSSGGAPGG